PRAQADAQRGLGARERDGQRPQEERQVADPRLSARRLHTTSVRGAAAWSKRGAESTALVRLAAAVLLRAVGRGWTSADSPRIDAHRKRARGARNDRGNGDGQRNQNRRLRVGRLALARTASMARGQLRDSRARRRRARIADGGEARDGLRAAALQDARRSLFRSREPARRA